MYNVVYKRTLSRILFNKGIDIFGVEIDFFTLGLDSVQSYPRQGPAKSPTGPRTHQLPPFSLSSINPACTSGRQWRETGVHCSRNGGKPSVISGTGHPPLAPTAAGPPPPLFPRSRLLRVSRPTGPCHPPRFRTSSARPPIARNGCPFCCGGAGNGSRRFLFEVDLFLHPCIALLHGFGFHFFPPVRASSVRTAYYGWLIWARCLLIYSLLALTPCLACKHFWGFGRHPWCLDYCERHELTKSYYACIFVGVKISN
jgi:hypothetical protein